MGNTHSSLPLDKTTLEKDGALELSLSADQIAADTLALARIPATLTGKDADTLDGVNSTGFVSFLTVVQFQENAATGTAYQPGRINDNNEVTFPSFDAIGEYCEIEFSELHAISEYRYRGNLLHNEDGHYKIQHWDGEGWVDNTTGISTRDAPWSDWADLDNPVITKKIRIVATAIDTGETQNLPLEWQLKG